ncbi:MAG: hypothetical protein KDA81_20800, partial [Planctomycetaceae bacterium]|nr:hypothetical protein [Planctomycetaceae bacterium]
MFEAAPDSPSIADIAIRFTTAESSSQPVRTLSVSSPAAAIGQQFRRPGQCIHEVVCLETLAGQRQVVVWSAATCRRFGFD